MTIRLTPSMLEMLTSMEASTGHKYYAAELEAKTGLSKTTVLSNLNRLHEAGYVRQHREGPVWNRASRIGYELQTNILDVIRLIPPSG